MTNVKRIQDAVTEFYSSSSDAVMTIRSGIDSLAIAIERLEDEVYAVEVSEKRAAKKCATKKSTRKAKGKK